LGTHSLTAADLVVNHVSGSGVAASITKGGNGEALTVVKTSGSGNAASITGGVTLLDELHLNTDLVDAYIASATNWNTAYTNRIVSASAPLSITSNAISITQANTSTNGFLSSTDWNTFNSKQNALTLGNVSEVSSNVLMFPDGGTGKTIGNLSIQVVQASASTNGYLSSTDWTTFNNKQATITGAATTITTSDLTASRALTSNASGKVDVSTVTSTELGYLSGVTSAIQTQLNAKQNTITNPVTGTGTTNYVTKWTSTSAVGNTNLINDASGNLGLGFTPGAWESTYKAIQLKDATSMAIWSGGYDANVTSNAIGTTLGGAIYGGSAFGASKYTQYDGAHIFYSASAGTAGNAISFSERMRITSSGSLGIGTTPPTTTSFAHLFVGRNFSVFSGSSTDIYFGSNFYYNGGFKARYSQPSSMISTSAGDIIFTNSSSGTADSELTVTEKMRITSAGNVGIGTSSPEFNLNQTSLTINGTNVSRLDMKASGTRNAGFVVASDAAYLETTAAIPLVFYANSTERMRILSNGNILIGTTSGGTSVGTGLTVSNNIYVQLRVQSTTSSAGIEWVSSTNYRYEVQASNAGEWFVYNRTTEAYRLMIKDNGNVILGGTSDPGYKLYVNGTIYATGNITANSDLTLKKNLKLVDNPIDKLNQLNGYLYQWKNNDEYQYGVIAQEVEKILPHAVSTGKDGIKGVSYNQLIPVMIEAIKVQQKEINELKSKIG
jgi:hypothetical protein